MTPELRKTRQLRKMQGYDPNPPLCGNCKRYVKPLSNERGKIKHFPAFCSLRGLNVSSTAVCDFWISRAGEVLL